MSGKLPTSDPPSLLCALGITFQTPYCRHQHSSKLWRLRLGNPLDHGELHQQCCIQQMNFNYILFDRSSCLWHRLYWNFVRNKFRCGCPCWTKPPALVHTWVNPLSTLRTSLMDDPQLVCASASNNIPQSLMPTSGLFLQRCIIT